MERIKLGMKYSYPNAFKIRPSHPVPEDKPCMPRQSGHVIAGDEQQ